MAHDVQWYSPAPFWPKRLKRLQNGTRTPLREPVLLGFERDDFMRGLQTTLAETPNALPDQTAEWEEYPERDGGAGPPNGSSEDASNGEPIPLYQPAHERYYLVTASLVCRERGLPDRAVDTANEEKAAFVLRRLVPDESGSVDVDGEPHAEYRWVTAPAEENGAATNGAANAEGKTGKWQRAADPLDVPKREERLSMFPQSYAPQTPVEAMKGKRRLWSGLLPVAKRDTYETAPLRRDVGEQASEAMSDDPLHDPRRTVFETRVIQAFKNLRDDPDSDNPPARADVRDPLLFAWLDFWEFLQDHLPAVTEKIEADEPAEAADFETKDKEKVALIDTLDALTLQPEIESLGTTASAVLRSIANQSDQIAAGNLDEVLSVDDLPPVGSGSDGEDGALSDFLSNLLSPNKQGDTLEDERPKIQKKVTAALGLPEKAGDLPENLQAPTTDPTTGGTYVVRCLYERPKCPEPIRTTVSKPSAPFRLASFFDAQAPPRDINITLPSASMQDLRDSSQSVSMVFTKELRNQAERVQNLTIEKLRKGESGSSPGLDIGMICSLSIPIITICALILLLIIVVLLNIVFWWLPFFKICLPIPTGESE